MRQMVDKRIDGGPCPRLVPPKDWPEAPAVPPPWKDYLMDEVYGPDDCWETDVYGPDYCWESSQDDDYRPDIVERPGDYVWNDLFDRDDQ